MKNVLVLISFVAFIFSAIPSTGQNLLWERQSPNFLTLGKMLAIDSEGHAISCGNGFNQSGFAQFAYIEKMDSAGQLIWRDSLPSQVPNQYHAATWVGVDDSDHILVLGYRFILSTTGSGLKVESPQALKVWKLSPAGLLVWEKTITGSFGNGGVSPQGTSNTARLDEHNNLYIGAVGYTDSLTITNAGFLMIKLDPSGNTLWENARQFGNIAGLRAMDYRNGKVVVTGSATFSGQDNVSVMWDSLGNEVWGLSMGATNQQFASDIVLDDSAYAYVFSQTARFVGANTLRNLSMTKVNLQGDTVFTKEYPRIQPATPGRMGLLPNGNLFLAGTTFDITGSSYLYTLEVSSLTGQEVQSDSFLLPQVNSRVYDLIVSPAGNTYLTGKSDNNGGAPASMFLFAFDQQGQFAWQAAYGFAATEPMGIALDAAEHVFITLQNQWVTVKYANQLVNQQAPVAQSQFIQLCFGESVTIGTRTYVNSGVYSDTLAGSGLAPDTILTTTLQIENAIDIQVNQTGSALEVVSLNGTAFQWMTCDNGVFLPLPGEDSTWFAPASNGSYAVRVSLGSCQDTSDCVQVQSVSLESDWEQALQVYPNPASSFVVISFAPGSVDRVLVYDPKGTSIMSFFPEPGSTSLAPDFSALPAGIYFIALHGKSNSATKKLIWLRE